MAEPPDRAAALFREASHVLVGLPVLIIILLSFISTWRRRALEDARLLEQEERNREWRLSHSRPASELARKAAEEGVALAPAPASHFDDVRVEDGMIHCSRTSTANSILATARTSVSTARTSDDDDGTASTPSHRKGAWKRRTWPPSRRGRRVAFAAAATGAAKNVLPSPRNRAAPYRWWQQRGRRGAYPDTLEVAPRAAAQLPLILPCAIRRAGHEEDDFADAGDASRGGGAGADDADARAGGGDGSVGHGGDGSGDGGNGGGAGDRDGGSATCVDHGDGSSVADAGGSVFWSEASGLNWRGGVATNRLEGRRVFVEHRGAGTVLRRLKRFGRCSLFEVRFDDGGTVAALPLRRGKGKGSVPFRLLPPFPVHGGEDSSSLASLGAASSARRTSSILGRCRCTAAAAAATKVYKAPAAGPGTPLE
ncbi:unnamed protein product [Phaeothamnion confervicola]